jgi:hypothetical protein
MLKNIRQLHLQNLRGIDWRRLDRRHFRRVLPTLFMIFGLVLLGYVAHEY